MICPHFDPGDQAKGAPMSRRLFLLLALLILFVGISEGRPLLRTLSAYIDRAPNVTRLALSDLNAPPAFDPECFDRLSALPGVTVTRSSSFTEAEVCEVQGAVFVTQLAGLKLTPRRALLQCGVAENLNAWLEDVAKPGAQEHLNANLTRLGHMGTYNCRTIGGSSSILSQHSFANAIDLAWFDLSNGTRTRLVEGWDRRGPSQEKFWTSIKEGSCDYFDVSLGPDHNAAHADHFHFDLGPMRTCR